MQRYDIKTITGRAKTNSNRWIRKKTQYHHTKNRISIIGRMASTESIGVFLNKCLTQRMIPESWQNSQVVLLYLKAMDEKVKILEL